MEMLGKHMLWDKTFFSWQISRQNRAVKTKSEFEDRPIEIIQAEGEKSVPWVYYM